MLLPQPSIMPLFKNVQIVLCQCSTTRLICLVWTRGKRSKRQKILLDFSGSEGAAAWWRDGVGVGFIGRFLAANDNVSGGDCLC